MFDGGDRRAAPARSRRQPAIHEAAGELDSTNGEDAAEAIMTTDTFAKQLAISVAAEGRTFTVGGMAKGSGMIQPNMATMLAFITTDAPLSPSCVRRDASFCGRPLVQPHHGRLGHVHQRHVHPDGEWRRRRPEIEQASPAYDAVALSGPRGGDRARADGGPGRRGRHEVRDRHRPGRGRPSPMLRYARSLSRTRR